MAAASKSKTEEDLFWGFGEEDSKAVAEWRQARLEGRNHSGTESDISVSSVATEDLSGLSDSEEEEDTWNENDDPIYISPFTAATGPTSGIAEDGTVIDLFHLMLPDELMVHIVIGTNRYAQTKVIVLFTI